MMVVGFALGVALSGMVIDGAAALGRSMSIGVASLAGRTVACAVGAVFALGGLGGPAGWLQASCVA